MKEKRILNALKQVDETYIQEANSAEKFPERTNLLNRGSLAACLSLIAAVCFSMFSPNGNMVVSAYAYGAEEDLTAATVITSTGTISDTGEVTGHPLMFFRSGEDIVTVRYSCENQMIKNTEFTIAFLDGENNEVSAEALWYNMAHVDRILVKWIGAAPETVQVYYTPSGTETIDQLELLCTKALSADDDEIVFSTEELGFAEMKYVQGHLQIDLGFGETKVSSEIYNVFYDPEES